MTRVAPGLTSLLLGASLLGLLTACSKSPPAPESTPEAQAPEAVHATSAPHDGAASNPNLKKPSEKLVNCTAKIAPGEDPTPHFRPGATVCFAAGTHQVNLRVEVPMTLVGEPGAILDGGGKGQVIHIAKDRIIVTVEDLRLTNGYAEFGSGMLVDGYARLTLNSVAFEGNTAGQGGGTGLGARVGELNLTGCSFGAEDDLVLTNIAKAQVSETTAHDVTVLDGAKMVWNGGSFDQLVIRGTTTRAPEVKLVGAAGEVHNDTNLPGTLTQE